MAKLFFEVFPTLSLRGEIHDLMEEAEVAKVTSNRAKDAIKVYIVSSRLIEKPQIFFIENEITRQLFQNRGITVKIMEKFNLSMQYTPERLMDVYRDSILEELRAYSLLLYNLFRCAKMKFDREDHMILTLEDSIVSQNRSDELIDILEKIVCERCGLKLMIEPEYEEAKVSRHIKNADIQMQQEVQNIIRLAAIHRDGEEEKAAGQLMAEGETGQKAQTVRAAKAEAAGGGSGAKTAAQSGSRTTAQTGAGGARGGFSGGKDFKGNGGFSGRRDFYRKSDNPDVIYGRDFEDEVIPIETIVGEMGEVAIRGQILSLDTREIRNEKTIVILSMTDFTDTIVLKIFTRNENLSEILAGLKKGAFIKVKGVTTIDRFDSELTIGSHCRNQEDSRFYLRADGQQPGETGGAALPHEDERYGRCVGCAGHHQTRGIMGT